MRQEFKILGDCERVATERGDAERFGDRRGILYPQRLPRFHRRAVPASLEAYARWFWVSQWDLPAGEESTQRVLPFPAANLVLERDKVTLSGPSTGVSTQVLTAKGWAFGILLRPAGLAPLWRRPAEIVDRQVPFGVGDLHPRVRGLMDAGNVDAAEARITEWMEARCAGQIPPGAVIADAMLALAADDPEVTTVALLAKRLGVSTREIQRVAGNFVGQTPLRIIRRYRLQEAAQRLREQPALTVAQVAAELGYSDQSHLAADFRTTLGLSARDYRKDSWGDEAGLGER